MQLRLRQCFIILGVLATGACADSPLATTSPETVRHSEMGAYVPPGDGGGCDKYTDPNFCQGPGTGTCITSSLGTDDPTEFVGVQSCPGGDGGGSGESPPPPPPPSPDSCLTGVDAFDTPAVRQGMKDLWTRSNPDAPQAQRREQGGWIVRAPNGTYSMVRLVNSVSEPCRLNGNFNAPQGAVAFVHTHPFRRGEVQTSCDPVRVEDPSAPGVFLDFIGPDGQRVYQVYDNQPSLPDRDLMSLINSVRGELTNQPLLAGVIMDRDRITVYTHDPAMEPEPFPRCGY